MWINLYNKLYKETDLTSKIIFSSIDYNSCDVFDKFNRLVIENPFLSETQRNKTILKWVKLKKVINAFVNFFTIVYKKIYIKPASQDCDLTCNLLSNYCDDEKITFIENNAEWEFYIPDLLKIINHSLLYQEDLFPIPAFPKNPHTNCNISKNNLYNLYFKIKASKFKCPMLFEFFFLSEFSLSTFILNYEAIIRDYHIKEFYNDKTKIVKYNAAIDMVNQFKEVTYRLKIHNSFSKDKVINAFDPILNAWAIYQYTHNPSKRTFAYNKIKLFLKNFIKKNYRFGRIQYTSCYLIE